LSRARPIELPDGDKAWFDTSRNGEPLEEAVSAETLDLLATIEHVDLDDLLDSALTQGEAIARIRKALGQERIPESIIERRDQIRQERQRQPKCRKCGAKGNSTKHHFVNKWILRELQGYAQFWADRQRNCIPLCVECHQNIHSRKNGPNSVVDLLNDTEKQFVEEALQALSEQHPKLLLLIARGDDSVYESRLAKDWIEGRFKTEVPVV
jgi:hypothetical protein